MKKIKFIVPILLLALIFIISFYVINKYLPANILHVNYEYYSFISSIFNGFLSPVIAIVGFYYLYLSFNETSKDKKIENIYYIIDKHEKDLDVILQSQVYNKKINKDEPWKTTLERNLSLSIPNNIHVEFFYESDCKSQMSLIIPILHIKKILAFIAQELLKIHKLDSNNDLEKYYKLKYSVLINDLSDETHYFTIKFEEYKKSCKIKKEIESIEDIICGFYSKNQFYIEN